MRHRLQWLAVACSVVASSSAMAGSTSTAKISNLTFTLYDLDPTDGITPSFEFLSGTDARGTTATSASVTDSLLGENGTDSLSRSKSFIQQSSDLLLDNVAAVSFVEQYSVTAHGQAAGPSTSYSSGATATAGSSNYYGNSGAGGIQLSPNSLLIIKGEGSVSASVNGSTPCGSYYYYCYNSDSSSASITMSLSFSGTDGVNTGNGSFSSQLTANANYSTTYQYNPVTGYGEYVSNPVSQDKFDFLSVAFTNNTDASQLAYLSLQANVSGNGYSGPGIDNSLLPAPQSSAGAASPLLSMLSSTADYTTYGFVAAVPEPTTWAFMMMGLVGIATAARRRDRQA